MFDRPHFDSIRRARYVNNLPQYLRQLHEAEPEKRSAWRCVGMRVLYTSLTGTCLLYCTGVLCDTNTHTRLDGKVES